MWWSYICLQLQLVSICSFALPAWETVRGCIDPTRHRKAARQSDWVLHIGICTAAGLFPHYLMKLSESSSLEGKTGPVFFSLTKKSQIMLKCKFIFAWNLNYTAALWLTQIPLGNLMEDLDTLLPPSFQKRATSAVQSSPVTVRLDVCLICTEKHWWKKMNWQPLLARACLSMTPMTSLQWIPLNGLINTMVISLTFTFWV